MSSILVVLAICAAGVAVTYFRVWEIKREDAQNKLRRRKDEKDN